MKSKKTFLFKKSIFLTPILFLVLVFAFTCQVLAARIIDEKFEVTGAYGYDMAGWTEEVGVTVDPGCTLDEDATPIPGTPPSHAQDECLKAIVLDNTNNNDAYAYQLKEPQDISYVRGYLYLEENGLNEGESLFTLVLYDASNQPVAGIQIFKEGVTKMRFLYYSDWLQTTGPMTIATGNWYRVEYKYDTASPTPAWAVRINGGTPVGDSLGITRTPKKMRIGIFGNTGAGKSTLYTDLVVWDDTQWPGEDTIHYVDADNNNPVYPYDTEATAATLIAGAVNACENAGTIYVKKTATMYSYTITMKSNVDVIGTDENWVPSDAPDYSDCPIVSGYYIVNFEGPLDNCTLEGFKIEGGSDADFGQIYINGSTGAVTNVTIRNCWLYPTQNQAVCILGPISFTIDHCDIDGPGTACIVGPGRKGAEFLHPISDAGSPIVIKDSRIHGAHMAGMLLGGDGTPQIIIKDSEVYDNYKAGIYLDSFGSVTIDNTSIYNNGISLAGDRAGVRIENAGSATIMHSDIYGNDKGGVRIGGNSNVTIGANLEAADPFAYGNDIHGNYGGIFFADNVSGVFIIRGNYIYNNSGGALEGGGIQLGTPGTATITISENDIVQNQLGGIGIKGVSSTLGETCTVVITKNNIHNNIIAGGIHTGYKTSPFSGNPQNANFTIRQNKVHHHSNANYGGGIDVRDVPGIIKNNLVYRNSRGGIRIGDYVTEVINNTVVWNGFNNTYGGGIIYDDPTTGALNAQPDRTYNDPTLPLIKNNICAFNKKAGIGVVFNNTVGDEERNYNLLYDNWYGETILGYNYGDCSWTGWPGCKKRQLGGSWPVAPNEIFADPLFVDMTNDDYHLDVGSPAIGTGEGGVDMGAYGGSDAIDDNDFPPTAHVHCLIDGDTSTGNTPAGGKDLFFDLGGTYTVRHVRLYGSADNIYCWTVYVADTSDGCTGTEVLSSGCAGGASQWYAGDVTDTQGSYIKIRSDATINEYSIFEFQFSDKVTPTTDDDWLTPVSAVEGCTDIHGLCK